MRNLFAAFWIALLAPSLSCAGIADKVVRKNVGGIDVIVYPTAIKDVVTFKGALPGGDAIASSRQGNPAVAQLTAMMLDRGTAKEDKFAVARKLEGAGAQLSFGANQQDLRFGGKFLKADMALVVGLLAEQLRAPAFSQSEFEKAKQEFTGQQRNMLTVPKRRAGEALTRTLFPAGHPNRMASLDEYIAAAKILTIDDVRKFHREVYGPDHMTLVFVGDVNPAEAQKAVAVAFSGWKGGVDHLRDVPKAANDSATKERNFEINIPGKTSSVLLIGQGTGMRARDADALPLQIGTAVLGSGFTGRLMSTVRVKEGLTYGIGASMGDDAYVDGMWSVDATFAPELLARGLASTQREVRLWWDKGITDDELAARKTNLIGSYQVGLARTSGLASALLGTVLSGRDVTWLDEYPKAVGAVTTEQVNAAIRKHLDPDKMVVVKAGTLGGGASK